MNYLVHERINLFLEAAGVPEKSLLTTEEMVLTMFAMFMTLLGYYIFFGKEHVRKRKRLTEDLKVAQMKVHFLEEKLTLYAAESSNNKKGQEVSDDNVGEDKNKEVRIFMDGAFDMMHYGHMNAFRLGRSLGTTLIVGVNSDESVMQCKGAPLLNDQERLTMVEGCKFVDEVVPGCPYIMNKEYLDYVISKYKIDYVIHGDDPCIVDGKDVYAAAKEAGKYQSIPRTEGVSTTDIIGRMLLMSKDHHYNDPGHPSTHKTVHSNLLGQTSKFLTTSRMLQLFSAGVNAPTPDMKIIYIDGAFDMFHPGHVSVLKSAKERGDYLMVGIHGDAVVNRVRGSNLPLMNLHERVLSVLGCQYVDDVLIDAPYVITTDMIKSLNISEVVHGKNSDWVVDGGSEEDRFVNARRTGILREIETGSSFNILDIIKRIQRNQSIFQAKFERKMKQEQTYYDEKYSRDKSDENGSAS